MLERGDMKDDIWFELTHELQDTIPIANVLNTTLDNGASLARGESVHYGTERRLGIFDH